MYFKVYLIVLTTCVLFLILLMQFQSLQVLQSSRSLSVSNNFTLLFNNQDQDSSSSAETAALVFIQMGDPRRGSNSSEKSSKSGSSYNSANSNSQSQSDQPDGLNQSNLKDNEHFDIILLNQHLKICIREKDNEVDLDEYIFVFQQLYKFFIMLGSVFGFVGSDVKSKIEILQNYRLSENKEHYETVEKMLEFEKSTDYIHSNKESSGSRTLLRLHRALNFVSKFLGKVDTIKDTDGTSHVCKEAYSQTLSKFHPWLIQKGATLAMYALPSKKDLIQRVCDGRIESSEVRKLLHDVIGSTERVYDKCESAYREKELLDLP